MKTNKILIILLLTAAMAFCGALAACQPQEEQFTVTFISEGEQFYSYTAEKGSEVQFPESQPQKAEDEQYTYKFVGWSLSEGGVTVQSHTVTQNVTFYAVFEAHEKQPPAPVEYTVTFIDGVTQQVLKTEKVPAGGSATAPQAPQHVGYEFSHWQGDYQNVTARTDVTAVYVQKQYTLVRHYLGKQVTQTLHYGDAIPAESLENPVGLNFLGWFADSDCTQPVSEVYPDGMPDAEGAVEVYAGYEVDLSSAVINLPANPVYGDSVTLSLPNTENVAFSYKWQTAAGAMEGASFPFEGAGSQTVTAVVTANYMDGLVITQKTLSATAEVARRPLQIKLDVEQEITYGQTAQPVVTVTGLLEEDSELKNNVTAAFMQNDSVCDGDKLAVGQYSVTVAAHGLDNYSYTLPSSSLTVKRAPLKVTVSANNVTYGEEAEVTYKVTGFVFGEDESVLKGTMLVMLNNVVYTGGILQCGSYTVTVGGATADNYSVQGGVAVFEVTKRTAQITLSATDVTYGNQPKVTFSHSGFLKEDADKISLDFTFDGKLTVGSDDKLTVGSHTVTATITDEYINKNYATQVTGAQFSVTKATLQVTVTAQNVIYGQNPAVSYDVTGFAYGEDDGVLGGSIVYTYQKDSENYTQSVFTVGSYTVTASGLSADNYDFNYTQASFEVSKKQVTVTVTADDVTFGQSADVTFTVSALAFEDTQQALGNLAVQILKDGEPYYGYEQSKLLAAGRYTATVTGFNNDNYDVQVQQDEFTVQKATFTVTANMQGAAGSSLSYTVPEQFGIFTFKGTFYLTTTDEGVYKATDETSFNKYFAWQSGYALTVTKTGEDVTANFLLAYDVTFTLTMSDFVITLPSQLTVVYTGKPNSYGITVQDADQIEGLSVTYAVKKDGTLSQFTETVPEFTYAGQYTVYYRVSAPGYETQADSFTVTVQKAMPEIHVPQQATEFTYTGERQYFNADGVTWSSREDGAELAIESFFFVTVAEGNGKQIKITSTETANYLSAEITVTLTVRKAQFTLPQPETQSYVYTGSAQGAPISVTALGDDQFTVWYNGGTTVAQFTDAGSYEVTVQVGGNDNYEVASTVYRVEIAKATHNEINVSDVNTQYVWDGQPVTVSGATALFGTVQYKNGVLTSAGQWQVTAYVEETTNYVGAEKQFTVYVAKGTYTDEQLQQALQNAVTGEVVFGLGKTLNDVPLADGFAFSNPSAALSAKNFTLSDGAYVGSFDGTYCGDADNYNPAEVTITFTARKQKVTVSVEGVSRKIGDVESDDGLFAVTAQGENGALSAEEIEVLSVSVSHGINFNVGGTYDVTYTLGQNDYYDAAFENGEKEIGSWFKLCSVLYDNQYYTLQDALYLAQENDTVIVAENTVASNSSAYCGDAYYTVKKGVTLLVPYDKDHSTNTKDFQRCYENGVSVPAVGTAYRTLTLPAGVTLTVENDATLIVNAKVVSASAPVTGIVYGSNFGQLEVQKDAQVVVNGTFECIGFTYGEGSVTVNSGAYLYELFNMIGYKGGTASLSLKNKLFPLNQYTLTSLSCPTTFMSGSSYYAKAFVTGKLLWVMDESADVQFASNSSDAFIQMNSENAYVEKRIDENTGRTSFDCYGDVILNNITLSLGGIFAFDTAGLPVPVPGHFSITVHGNAAMAKETQIKLLPGAQLTVEKGATLTVAGSDGSVKGGLSSYDGNAVFDSGVTQWKDGAHAYPIAQFKTVYRTAPTPDYSAATPAVILVKGTLKVSSTAYFAGVVTGEEGGIVELAEGAATAVTLKEILSGSDTYTATLNAILKGANTINQVTAGTYTYTDGSWVLKPAA